MATYFRGFECKSEWFPSLVRTWRIESKGKYTEEEFKGETYIRRNGSHKYSNQVRPQEMNRPLGKTVFRETPLDSEFWQR